MDIGTYVLAEDKHAKVIMFGVVSGLERKGMYDVTCITPVKYCSVGHIFPYYEHEMSFVFIQLEIFCLK